MSCDCGGEVEQTISRDPHTNRDHMQYICIECGELVENPDNGRMV